jgi:hypothetical protein
VVVFIGARCCIAAFSLSKDTQCVFCSVTIDMGFIVNYFNAQICTSLGFGSRLLCMSDDFIQGSVGTVQPPVDWGICSCLNQVRSHISMIESPVVKRKGKSRLGRRGYCRI